MEETLEVHPEDIARLGLEDGGWAEMSNPRGCPHVKVRAPTKSPKGTVFASFAFTERPSADASPPECRGNLVHGLPALVSASRLPAFRPVYDAFSRSGFYNLNPTTIRTMQSPDPGDLMNRDGADYCGRP